MLSHALQDVAWAPEFPYTKADFKRQIESADGMFYKMPRLVCSLLFVGDVHLLLFVNGQCKGCSCIGTCLAQFSTRLLRTRRYMYHGPSGAPPHLTEQHSSHRGRLRVGPDPNPHPQHRFRPLSQPPPPPPPAPPPLQTPLPTPVGNRIWPCGRGAVLVQIPSLGLRAGSFQVVGGRRSLDALFCGQFKNAPNRHKPPPPPF